MAKTYDYIITLRKSTAPWLVNAVCQLLLLISVICFIYSILVYRGANYPLLIATVLILGWWLLILFSRRRKPYYRFALMVCGIGWMLFPLHRYIIGIAYIIVALLEKQVKFPSEIGIDTDGILINSLPKKSYGWDEIKHIIIKDNILTIDLRSNKLLQKEIQDFVSPTLEKEFNEYCQAQLGNIVE